MPWLLTSSVLLLLSPLNQEASRDRVQEAVREVLSSRDYDDVSLSPTIGQRILEKIKEWFSAIGRIWQVSEPLAWTVMIVACLALIAIAVHFFTVLFRATRSVKEAREGRAAVARREDPRLLLDRARKAPEIMAKLRLYVQAAIAGLDRRGVVRLLETATVREYRSFLTARPGDAASFDRLMSTYEPGVFGRKPVAAEAIQECDRAAVQLIGGEP